MVAVVVVVGVVVAVAVAVVVGVGVVVAVVVGVVVGVGVVVAVVVGVVVGVVVITLSGGNMKHVPQFKAVVEKQLPAVDGVAQFIVVGECFGSYQEVWAASKKMCRFPVITMKDVYHGQEC